MVPVTGYDKRETFTHIARPFLESLRTACEIHGFPFFFEAAVSSSSQETEYVVEGTRDSSDPIIHNEFLVREGEKVIPAQADIEIDAE